MGTTQSVWKWIETAPSGTVTGSLSKRDSSELSSRFFIESPLFVSIPSSSRLHPHILSFRLPLHLCLLPSLHSLSYHHYFAVAFCTKSRRERSREQARSKASAEADHRARSTKPAPSHDLLAANPALALGDNTTSSRR